MNRSTRLVLAIVLLVSSSAFACQVPVFRYALERWPSDTYKIVILHDGALDAKHQTHVDRLKSSLDAAEQSVNAEMLIVESTEIKDDRLKHLWSEHGKTGDPVACILYPDQAAEIPDGLVQAIPIGDETIERVIDSPIRREVGKRLLSGESAVWIFVPCGDKKQDDEAYEILKQQIRINEERLELPPPEELEADDVSIEATHIELRIDFSIVTLDRDDPQEQFLLRSLLRSESDLEELNQPMAFPVLGRGRVLYALVGKGISGDTIAMASSFIVGPCSCQVKNLNPGFDLLLNIDWEEGLGGEKISKELPDESAEPVLLTIPPGQSK